MFYAAKNSYSTESSIGFCNTWFVVGFPTAEIRDSYVRQCPELATKSIKSSEVKNYGGKPGRVSFYDADGEYHQHMGQGEFTCY